MAANSQFSMAVHVLTLLAQFRGEHVKSKFLAASVNTNAVVIRRLVRQLQNAGLVLSYTGASGGTKLSRDPSKIQLVDVYRAVVGGEVFALHAKPPSQDCPVGRNIEAVLCQLQKEIDKAVDARLAEYSLEDVIVKIGAAGV